MDVKELIGKVFTISYENIYIKPFILKELTELSIKTSINNHSTIFLTGLLNEEQSDLYVTSVDAKTAIEVGFKGISDLNMPLLNEALDLDISEMPLFRGIVTNINVKSVRGMYYIEIEGVSNTSEMDVKRKRRSFQNKEMLYSDLVKQVLVNYPKSDYIDCITNKKKLEKFILQHDETDWDFLKRMASHFKAGLVPDPVSDTPKFWFGVPKRNECGLIPDHSYTVGKKFSDFRRTTENYIEGAMEADFIYYQVETEMLLNIGDSVILNGKKLYVYGVETKINKGTLRHLYTLVTENGLRQNPTLNMNISGASLEGKVIDVKEDFVRVHLDIDKNQKKEDAWWFPYSTFYTSEGSTGWYCMPELGDSVKVYFPENMEEEGIVLDSIRRRKKPADKLNDPKIKYFRTRHGKEMKFAPKELMLTAKDNGVYIKIDEDKGVTISSEKKVQIKSDTNISFTAGAMEIIGGKEIDIKCKTSSIKMNGVTHVKGVPVKEEQGLAGSFESAIEKIAQMAGIASVKTKVTKPDVKTKSSAQTKTNKQDKTSAQGTTTTQTTPQTTPQTQSNNQGNTKDGPYTRGESTTCDGKRGVNYYVEGKLKLVHVGGSRSWRNNNPGNVRAGAGSIGKDSGNFAIFPDYDTGFAAMKSTVTKKYSSFTLEKMMYKYAPPSENDTEAYIAYLVKKTGIPKDSVIGELSDTQENSLLKAMVTKEGFITGEVVKK